MVEQQRRFRDLLYKKLNRRYEILSIPDRTRREQIMTRLIDDIMATLGPLNRRLYQHTKDLLSLDPFLRHRKIQVAPKNIRKDEHAGKYNRFINYYGLKATVENVRKSIDKILGQFPTIDKIISVGSGTGWSGLANLYNTQDRRNNYYYNRVYFLCRKNIPLLYNAHPTGNNR